MYLPCCSGTTVPRLRTSDSYLSRPQTSRHPPVRPLRPQRITNLSRNRITIVDHAVTSHAPLPTTGYRRRQVGSYRQLPSRSLLSLVLISSPVLRALSLPAQSRAPSTSPPPHLRVHASIHIISRPPCLRLVAHIYCQHPLPMPTPTHTPNLLRTLPTSSMIY